MESCSENFLESASLFLDKYNAWKVSLEDEETDACANTIPVAVFTNLKS